MIRSIAFELFDRLTTDPDALRKQVAEARSDRHDAEMRLLDAKQMIESIRETKLFSRRKLEADNATMTTRIEELAAERDELQLQVNELQRDISQCNEYNRELLSEKCKAEEARTSTNRAIAEFRDRLQTIVDEQLGPQETLGFAELLTHVEDGLRKGSRAEAQFLLGRDKSDLTIEPTWILAAWSVSGSEWTEVKRGGYDSMLAEMRRNATSWNLFPRSAWDALVKNGRAR